MKSVTHQLMMEGATSPAVLAAAGMQRRSIATPPTTATPPPAMPYDVGLPPLPPIPGIQRATGGASPALPLPPASLRARTPPSSAHGSAGGGSAPGSSNSSSSRSNSKQRRPSGSSRGDGDETPGGGYPVNLHGVVEVSSTSFPVTADIKTMSGIPWGIVVCPNVDSRILLPKGHPNGSTTIDAATLARCERCGAYINSYCSYTSVIWKCALCSNKNRCASAGDGLRYARGPDPALPEVKCPVIEAIMSAAPAPASDTPSVAVCAPQVVYLAIVDTLTSDVVLEHVKTALRNAVHRLPDGASFGLITCGPRMGVFDLRCEEPHVLYFRTSTTTSTIAAALKVLPVAVPLAGHRDQCAAAISSLVAEDSSTTTRRSFDFAITNTVQCLVKQFDRGQLAGARVLSFVSGLPFQSAEQAQTDGVAGTASAGTARALLDIARAAASRGIRIDIFALASVPHVASASPAPSTHGSSTAASSPGRQVMPLVSPAVQQAVASPVVYPHSPVPSPSTPGGLGGPNWHVPNPDDVDLARYASEPHTGDSHAAERLQMALALLAPVALHTGGWLLKYNMETLDGQRRLQADIRTAASEPQAFQGLLRVRCSSGFHLKSHTSATMDDAGMVAQAGNCWYGPGCGDRKVENLWHLAAASPTTCVSALFEYDTSGGFKAEADMRPVLQLAYAHTVLQPVRQRAGSQSLDFDTTRTDSGEDSDTDLTTRTQWMVVRRLRIVTFHATVAYEPDTVLRTAHMPSALHLLTQQVLEAMASGMSPAEARAQIQYWHVALLARAHVAFDALRSATVDPRLPYVPQFQMLSREVFGMLHHPAFAEIRAAATSIPDAVVLGRQDLRTCNPNTFMSMVYPELRGFVSDSQAGTPRLSLSLQSVVTSAADRIFLIVSPQLVVLYYAAAANSPFPPPADSLLGRTVLAALKCDGPCPKLVIARSGSLDAHVFHQQLVEDGHEAPLQGSEAAPRSTAAAAAADEDEDDSIGYAKFVEAAAASAASMFAQL